MVAVLAAVLDDAPPRPAGLKDGVVEYQGRRDAEATRWPVAEASANLLARLKA